MPALSGSDRAYQFALAGACRSGATRSDYYKPVAQVVIAGTARSAMVDKETMRITDALNAQPNTCSFECFDFTPLRGQEVIVSLGSTSNRIFAGHILSIAPSTKSRYHRVRWRVDCVDYTWLLDTRRVTGRRFTGESVTNIVTSLISEFAPTGFTTTTVEASMDAIDFTTNHAETLMQALTRLMKMASKSGRKGGYIYIDYLKRVHAFVTPESTANPSVLRDSLRTFWDLTYAVDASQVRTRTYVLGAVTQATSTVPNASTAIPVDDTRFFSASGGYGLSYGNQLVYASTSPASGPGWLTGVTSFTYSIPRGESVRVLAIAVNSTAASSMAAFLGTGDGLLDHVIEDERLSAGGAQSRADVDVGLFAQPEQVLTYSTRDKFAFSGKTLSASMTLPTPISAQLVIQSVEMRDIGIGQSPRFPVRRVTAATAYRDVFELLAAADRLSTEGAN